VPSFYQQGLESYLPAADLLLLYCWRETPDQLNNHRLLAFVASYLDLNLLLSYAKIMPITISDLKGKMMEQQPVKL